MTNENIIYNAAVNSGLFSASEAQAIVASGRRLPLHTYSEWRRMGYQVKRGERAALSVVLWKYCSKTVEVDGQEQETGDCHRTTAHLFTAAQVEKAEPVKVKSRDEIMAYNRMLAEQRKARAAS